jgi:hypothetical protein
VAYETKKTRQVAGFHWQQLFIFSLSAPLGRYDVALLLLYQINIVCCYLFHAPLWDFWALASQRDLIKRTKSNL